MSICDKYDIDLFRNGGVDVVDAGYTMQKMVKAKLYKIR